MTIQSHPVTATEMPYDQFALLVQQLTGREQRWQTDFCDLTNYPLHRVQAWRNKGVVPAEAVNAARRSIHPSRLVKTGNIEWTREMQSILSTMKKAGESNLAIAEALSARFGVHVNPNMIKGQWTRLRNK